MNKLTNFDVLIVYGESIARSASDSNPKNIVPFAIGSRNESYNIVYGYFLEVCAQYNLKAAFTTSADIVGPGFCKCYWIFKDHTWIRVNSVCFSSLIFDKFSPINNGIKSRRQLLFSSDKVKPFNDPGLFNLFFDKQKTYEKLSDYSIPTIPIKEKTLQSIDQACQELNKLIFSHPTAKDFSPDIIMKDRFGAGGRHVHKFKIGDSKSMLSVAKKNSQVSYIIQPFTLFDQGFSYQNNSASTDIRLIYLKGKIVQSYIRVAKSGEFRCNEHQGGLLTYLSLNEIPSVVVDKSNLIAQELNQKCSLYTLDFIVSNNGNPYLLEGNTGPGLDWNMALKKNEIYAKKLIKMIVEELTLRSQELN
jgi:glutathione synthase/RimK-type ligase-like ATP-grasp enzyme